MMNEVRQGAGGVEVLTVESPSNTDKARHAKRRSERSSDHLNHLPVIGAVRQTLKSTAYAVIFPMIFTESTFPPIPRLSPGTPTQR